VSYDFQPFLDRIDVNWFDDDAILRSLLEHHRGSAAGEAHATLREWSGRCAGPLRELAEESAQPQNRPRLNHYDARGRRVDEIVLPRSTRGALAEVEGRERLGCVGDDPLIHYAKVYLYAQNGEAGVACSLACTDGLVRALAALGDRVEHNEVVEKVRGSTAERLYHGAQFVTEIQGGSDVAANETRAFPDGDAYSLRGAKWFCSNVNADYFLVTALPHVRGAAEGSVGLFLVPAYLPGDEGRNGYTIDRLKDKLGTRELATAEITFVGARAYAVGPLERGLPNLLRYVLVPSRFHCALAAAAYLRRAERIVDAYTDFRTAFGRKLAGFPLVEESVARIRRERRYALAAVLELLRLWRRADEAPKGGGGGGGGGADRLDFRVMLSLCKTVLTRRCTGLLHESMMLLGGNGIEERFSPLPRLYRDSVINETWEGPHNVLLSQALRDLLRHGVKPDEFIGRIAGTEDADLAGRLAGILKEARDRDVTVPFARLADPLVTAFAERAGGG
jgi:alkylation response protein AidB-like acyl-CoA dehydrogenase